MRARSGRILAAVLAAAVVLALQGGLQAQQARDTLILELRSDIRTYNIALRFDVSWFPSTLYFNRLVAMDYGPEFKVRPDLARKWEVSPDGRTYTFHLARNVKWHDGKPFTSADVKYTLEGIRQFRGQAYLLTTSIERIETPDPYTVKITTRKVDSSFLAQMAVYPRTPILPRHLYEGTDWNTNPLNMKPVGTGPFKFERHVQGQTISFVRNDEYFKGTPYLRRVVFRIIPDNNVAIAALKSGEIHAFTFPPEQRGPLTLIRELDTHPNLRVVAYPSPMVFYLAFNVQKPPYNDQSVRKAVAMAIDREDVNRRITQGICKPAVGTYTQAVPWAFDQDARLPNYNVREAEALLDRAGHPRAGGGVRFKMDLWVSRGTEIDTAQVVREHLRRVGIDMNINLLEDALMRQTLPQLRHDAYIFGNWWGPDPDEWATYTVTDQLWSKPMGYSNPKVDDLFAQARESQDLQVRRRAYVTIQRIMLTEMPRVPLFESCPYSFAHRKEWTGWFTDAPYSYRLDLSRVRPVGQ
ncbi:MAG: hypothetical protein HY660_06705 [Armatimonadetes bacterium]|nr:hypothetical protein [Armatimonadota bacterium]